MDDRATELRAADFLLQRGVKVQVAAPLFFRIFGRKKITMYAKALTPTRHLEISRKFLQMGIENTADMTLKEAFEIYLRHGKKMSEIVAISVPGFWPYKLRAWVMRNGMNEKELSYLFHLIIAYGGIEDFINSIRLLEATRITKPMNLSPEEKMS